MAVSTLIFGVAFFQCLILFAYFLWAERFIRALRRDEQKAADLTADAYADAVISATRKSGKPTTRKFGT